MALHRVKFKNAVKIGTLGHVWGNFDMFDLAVFMVIYILGGHLGTLLQNRRHIRLPLTLQYSISVWGHSLICLKLV